MKKVKKDLKMRYKRGFALFLALAICLGTTPSMAFAADEGGSVAESSSDSGSSDDSGGSDSGSSDNGGGSDSGSSDNGGGSDSGSSDDSGGSDSGSSDGSGGSDSGSSDDSGGSDSESSDDSGGSDSESSDDSGSSDSGSPDGTGAGGTPAADAEGTPAEDAGGAAAEESPAADAEGTPAADTGGGAPEDNGPGEAGNVENARSGYPDEAIGSADLHARARSETNEVPFGVSTQGDESGADQGNAASADPDAGVWKDITDTKRPAASDTVSHDKGTDKDTERDWDVFYDTDRDVYKITFNIGKEAEDTQVIDLTQALELLGQYVESGKQELQDAIDAIPKPVKEDAGEPPVKADAGEEPVEPEKPAGFDQEEPLRPEEPVEPGKPEGLEEKVTAAFEAFAKMAAAAPEASTFANARQYLAEQGLDGDDAYLDEYAEYMMKAADIKQAAEDWAHFVKSGHFYFSYFGDLDTFLYYGCRMRDYKWSDGKSGQPYFEAPVYKIDKDSASYKAYEAAKAVYEEKMAQYKRDKAAYDAALEAYMAEHGPESEAGKAYAKAMDAYRTLKAGYEQKVADIQARYEADMAAYDANLAAIEKKYADDQAAYDKKVAELKADFDRRVGANVLEPGDSKKFELYLTSDSKHTYKYQLGSFTLATPGWMVDTEGNVIGFDGQILPDEYIDHANYNVTVRSEPIQALYEAIGLDAFDKFNGHPGWANYDIKQFLGDYEGDTLADQLNSYILAYYNGKNHTEYATIDELVRNNADARAELTKTETSGNKWFAVSGETFKVDAHLETVKYDNFYNNLFSFAFGDEADIDNILGKSKFNTATNRWEYENKSWTNNDYQLALYYYMDHKDIWQQTDAYFSALLDGGLTTEQATWTSLMMALNIDGELTGNDWQSTRWPWYSSISLEQMDIDFSLSKKDDETGETITESEAEFQIYYINKVADKDGNETSVNMYCTEVRDDEGNVVSYTFVAAPSTVWTKKGELNISYAMMKDIVYYLQEMTAPEGYERDTNVYIVMSKEDYDRLSEEDKKALEGTFDRFLDMTVSENGLKVNTDFINVKIVTTEPKEPEGPENPPSRPRRDRTPIPDEPTPQTSIPEAPVPLASIPDIDAPLTVLLDEDVPLANVPKTGDISSLWHVLLALSGIGLLGMAAINAKKSKESEND